MTYLVFTAGMFVAGAGAGLLNSETTKAMQGAVPAQRAGMASGLTSTVRFVGLLLEVAGLEAVLSKAISREFIAAAPVQSLDPRLATAAAKRVAAGDLAGFMDAVPPDLQSGVHHAAQAAFAGEFYSNSRCSRGCRSELRPDAHFDANQERGCFANVECRDTDAACRGLSYARSYAATGQALVGEAA